MTAPLPVCRTIRVVAFRRDLSATFCRAFLKALDDEKHGRGPGPTSLDCVLFAGHTGVSTDGGSTVFGFNPDPAGAGTWQLMDRLKNGDPFPGVVRDDTTVFSAAQNHGLTVLALQIILPEPAFQEFERRLDAERKQSQYSYGFPNGDGDCNCTTWLERLGLPLLTGRMDEFASLPGIVACPDRRFGRCL
jgi:hypothetical protein